MAEKIGAEKIGYINGLRGIAIVMVLAHHILQPLISPLSYEDTSAANYFLLQPFLHNGWLGVNIFFVLSGFVLYLPLAQENAAPFDSVKFLKKRGWRLLPLYYVNVLVCLVLFLGEPLMRILSHTVFYLFAAVPSPLLFFPPMNPPLWSLGIEIWFSILFPLILILVRRNGPVTTLLVLAALSIGFHAFSAANFQVEGKYLNDFSDTLPGRLSDFCFGMLAAHWWVKLDSGQSLSINRLRVFFFLGCLLIYLALVLSLARYVGDVMPIAQTFANLSIALGTVFVILSLVDGRSAPSATDLLEMRALQLVGMMCFSIYIWHWQILHAFNVFWGDQSWAFGPMVLVYLSVLGAVSVISYRFIEFWHKDFRSIFYVPKRLPRDLNRAQS